MSERPAFHGKIHVTTDLRVVRVGMTGLGLVGNGTDDTGRLRPGDIIKIVLDLDFNKD